jgi:hypothetical protein
MDSMVHLEPKVDLVISQMVEQLDKISGHTFDLGLWLQLYAFGTCMIPNKFSTRADEMQISSVPLASQNHSDTSKPQTIMAYSYESKSLCHLLHG